MAKCQFVVPNFTRPLARHRKLSRAEPQIGLQCVFQAVYPYGLAKSHFFPQGIEISKVLGLKTLD